MEKIYITMDEQGIHDRLKVGLDRIASQCAALQQLITSLRGATIPALLDSVGEASCPGTGHQLAAEQSLCEDADATLPDGPGEVPLSEQIGELLAGVRHSGEVPHTRGGMTLREGRDRVEKGMISAAVGNCGGNMARASELLGVSRSALYDLMKKHGLFNGHRHPSDNHAHAPVARHELAEIIDRAESL